MIPTTSRNLAITIRRMAAGPCTVLYQGAVPLISVAYLSLALCLVRIELGAVRGGATCLAGRDAGLWMLGLCARVTATTMTTAQSPP